MNYLLGLFRPLCDVIHFIEGNEALVSWVMPLLTSIGQDMMAWAAKQPPAGIPAGVAQQVRDAFDKRWSRTTSVGMADGRFVSLKSPEHVLATYLDPYLTPSQIPVAVMQDIEIVVKRLYPDTARFNSAMSEFNNFVRGDDEWSLVRERLQARAALTEDDERQLHGSGFTAKKIAHLRKMMSVGHAVMPWTLTYKGNSNFDMLVPIAERLLVVKPTSCSVERVCSQNRIVIPKGRSRLTDENAMMALYCYVNLRLLNKVKGSILPFLESMMEVVSSDDGIEEEDTPSAFSSLPTNGATIEFTPADLLRASDAGAQLPTDLIFNAS